MAKKKEDVLWVDEAEQQAKELCEKEHSCSDDSDHDCGDWLTYPEVERQAARQRIVAKL